MRSIRVSESLEASMTVGSHSTTSFKNRLNLMQFIRKSGRIGIDVRSPNTASEKHLIDVGNVLSELIVCGYFVKNNVVRFSASIIKFGAVRPTCWF